MYRETSKFWKKLNLKIKYKNKNFKIKKYFYIVLVFILYFFKNKINCLAKVMSLNSHGILNELSADISRLALLYLIQ